MSNPENQRERSSGFAGYATVLVVGIILGAIIGIKMAEPVEIEAKELDNDGRMDYMVKRRAFSPTVYVGRVGGRENEVISLKRASAERAKEINEKLKRERQ